MASQRTVLFDCVSVCVCVLGCAWMLRVMGSVRRGQVFCQDPQITTLLQPWKIPAKSSPADAFADLEAVVRAYPPGLHGEMQEMHGNAAT